MSDTAKKIKEDDKEVETNAVQEPTPTPVEESETDTQSPLEEAQETTSENEAEVTQDPKNTSFLDMNGVSIEPGDAVAEISNPTYPLGLFTGEFKTGWAVYEAKGGSSGGIDPKYAIKYTEPDDEEAGEGEIDDECENRQGWAETLGDLADAVAIDSETEAHARIALQKLVQFKDCAAKAGLPVDRVGDYKTV